MSASAWSQAAGRAADLWAPAQSPYFRDPAGWVRERLGGHLWSAQQRILESVRDHRRTAVPACHGPGKSITAGRAACWWLDAHPPGEAFVVTSAPTYQQVTAILWREIGRAHRQGKLAGRITQSAEWKIADELVAYGRKPADHDEHGFVGIHSRYILVILDEAGGVPHQLWTAAGTLLTNEDARILAIGNPDDPQSEFAAVCQGADPVTGGMSDRGWNVIPISAFDTPNFTDEPIPAALRPYLVGPEWVEEFTRDVGVDSPLYTSKVLGQFPLDAAEGVVGWSYIKACQGEAASLRVGPLRVPVELGIDVGGSDNGDQTVIREREGMRAGRVWRIRSGDGAKVMDLIMAALVETRATSVKIDAIGLGKYLASDLRTRGLRREHRAVVHDVNVAVAAEQPTRFVNLRCELWWEIGREFSRSGAWDLTDVDDVTLADLAASRYFERKGRLQIEEKAEIRKRLGRSPDDADALLLAFYVPPSVEPVSVPYQPAHDTRLRGRR